MKGNNIFSDNLGAKAQRIQGASRIRIPKWSYQYADWIPGVSFINRDLTKPSLGLGKSSYPHKTMKHKHSYMQV